MSNQYESRKLEEVTDEKEKIEKERNQQLEETEISNDEKEKEGKIVYIVFNILKTIVLIVLVAIITFRMGYRIGNAVGINEKEENYEIGVLQGALLMGAYEVLLMEESMPEDIRKEMLMRCYKLIINPDQKEIDLFLDDFYEKVSEQSIEMFDPI